MAKSVAHKRKVNAYPSTVNFKLLSAESDMTSISRSRIVDKALKQYYDSMPEGEKRRLLNWLK